mmetsp:Transcript_62108/g.148133  ORF Transcript_62108/g.148133 Transcript_62108/m.148133 type:complete len:80 (-) Transcript_62108:948-1187(-)
MVAIVSYGCIQGREQAFIYLVGSTQYGRWKVPTKVSHSIKVPTAPRVVSRCELSTSCVMPFSSLADTYTGNMGSNVSLM